MSRFHSTEILLGKDSLMRLKNSTVIVIGLGGVGGYAAEAIIRAGIGRVIIADYDKVAPSNINRQILALTCNVGRLKCDVARERFTEINPEAEIITFTERVTPSNVQKLLPEKTDNLYAIDAIDEIESKVSLIKLLYSKKIPFVSSMGAGSRLNPLDIRVDDISKTTHCPLARIIRKRLKEEGIEKGVRCIYSRENLNKFDAPEEGTRKKSQGSISYMPGIFGLTAAGIIINDIIKSHGE